MDIPASLENELAQIREEQKLTIQTNCKEGNQICVIIENYLLPKGVWNKDKTDLLILVPPAYPNGKLDMFWTDENLTYADGTIAQSTESIENKCGRSWRRFSRHISQWNPARDNIMTYLLNIDHWLRNKKNI